jgi:hypothetical protein
VTFNHGVEGSSPSALTMQNQRLTEKNRFFCETGFPLFPTRPSNLGVVMGDTDTIGLIVRIVAVLAVLIAAWRQKRKPKRYARSYPHHQTRGRVGMRQF